MKEKRSEEDCKQLQWNGMGGRVRAFGYERKHIIRTADDLAKHLIVVEPSFEYFGHPVY